MLETAALERRFEMIVRSLRNDIKTNINKRLQNLGGTSTAAMLADNTKREPIKTKPITRKRFCGASFYKSIKSNKHCRCNIGLLCDCQCIQE